MDTKGVGQFYYSAGQLEGLLFHEHIRTYVGHDLSEKLISVLQQIHTESMDHG